MNDKQFKELKSNAIKIWQSYDDRFGYATEKIETINRIKNVTDNYGIIIGMFDIHNQRKLYNAVSTENKELIDKWVGGLNRLEALAKEMGLFSKGER